MRARFALLIGALGCDTARFFRELGSHPQVLACRVAEPRFFTDDRKWALGADWYRSLWDFREPESRIALEASSDYALHPSVPCPAERVARMPAGFRILYLLRDPLARIEAHHEQARAEGWADASPDETTLAHYVDVSRYAAQLELWRAHFPREEMLPLCYEAWCEDAPAELARAARFLGIDPYAAFTACRRPAASPEAARGRERPQRALAAWWRRRRPERRSVPSPAWRLSPEQRAGAAAELREDAARLAREWGFDLSRWKLDA